MTYKDLAIGIIETCENFSAEEMFGFDPICDKWWSGTKDLEIGDYLLKVDIVNDYDDDNILVNAEVLEGIDYYGERLSHNFINNINKHL